jgi:type IV pilus assembly protein PilO
MSKLDALTDRPWYVQAALFGAVAVVLYLGFWYFVTRPTREETAKTEEEVATLQRANAGAQIAAQRLNEFKANYARAQADYDDLKALLPEQRELTMVLHNIQERARGHLAVMRFTPMDEVQKDFYTGKPIEVVVSGTYNDVGKFFAQIASYQRIVSITDFKITRIEDKHKDKKGNPAKGPTVDAQFLLTAYYAPPEKLNAVPEPEKQPKKGKGKKDKGSDKKKEEEKKEAA